MSLPIIRASSLGKRYRIGQRPPFRTIRGLIRAVGVGWIQAAGRIARRKTTGPADYHWALRDVSFEIAPGDVVGVIGRNGAGKSTLLKVLSQITKPTEGHAEIRGRIGSLLEVGTGFHPELTGRENVYLNGAILGMSRQEIRRKFDRIVEFSGIEKYLDTPVKRYSSGMQVRLAFAVAAHLEPDILVIDEVLAVGDAEFQKKCLGKMGDVTRHGRTILFVSHNMASIQSLCTRGLWLERGRLAYQGSMRETIEAYLAKTTDRNSGLVDLSEHSGRPPGLPAFVRRIGLRAGGSGELRRCVATGENVEFEIHYDVPNDVWADHVELRIQTTLGQPVLTLATDQWRSARERVVGRGRVVCRVRELALNEGDYSVTISLGTKNPPRKVDVVEEGLTFEVEFHDYFETGAALLREQGIYAVRSEWEFGGDS